MNPDRIRLNDDWKQLLLPEFEKPYMAQLREFLKTEMATGQAIFPKPDEWFNALNSTEFDRVKVVILGQDPYPTPGHAHGLCFSVQPGVRPPKSLQNIYKELADDLGIHNRSGNLQSWAEQGVLLLNTVLTVASGNPASHQGKGWEHFTDRIIELLNEHRQDLIFVLWGAHAQKKAAMIDGQKHLILKAPHPSPLSAHRGFFGSKPFSEINDHLRGLLQNPINWQLPN